jgi:hypothetical protein
MSSAIASTSVVTPEPSIGHASIPQETVNQTVDALIQMLAQPYLALVGKTINMLQEIPTLYQERGQPFSYFEHGKISIPRANIEGLDKEEGRYFAECGFETAKLTEETPFYSLLKPLYERISSLGYICDLIDLRFEKGCFQCDGNYWHRDYYRTAVTVCFGTIDTWCTHVFSEKHDPEKLTVDHIKPGSPLKEMIESHSEPSHFGYLYDAKNLHRAPLITDLKDQPITEKDYRLLLRFFKMRNELQ